MSYNILWFLSTKRPYCTLELIIVMWPRWSKDIQMQCYKFQLFHKLKNSDYYLICSPLYCYVETSRMFRHGHSLFVHIKNSRSNIKNLWCKQLFYFVNLFALLMQSYIYLCQQKIFFMSKKSLKISKGNPEHDGCH